jgi:hypothetical protein
MSKSPSGAPRQPRPATNTHTKKNTNTKFKSNPRTTDTRVGARSFRQRHPVLTALVPVGLVVAAIATMVVIKAAGNANPSAGASASATGSASSAGATADVGTSALSPQVVRALSVPTTALDAVGSTASVSLPTKVGNGTIGKAADGKPLITYVGAEYCPFCAAERWALAVALSRFGTFENLSGTHSSTTDEYPNTQTLSFYGSSYSSPYVDFQADEEATNQQVGNSYQPLQAPTAAQSALMAKYDAQGSIPFLDIANRYVIAGSSFSPQVLQGLSRSQIAADLSNPNSAVAQAIDGTANDITAAIASVTGNQPAAVGNSATIATIAHQLGA